LFFGLFPLSFVLSAPIRKYGDVFLSREARKGRHSLAHGEKPWVGAEPVERSPARGGTNRLNLDKARAVDKKIRYRATPKRLEGSPASLIKARQSPNYKPYVRYGLRAVDLRQSALQVGETLEEYDRHTQLVERVLPAP